MILIEIGAIFEICLISNFGLICPSFVETLTIPICYVVAEGGDGTLETVFRGVNKNIPAVIVKGSGRIADIIAFAYEKSEKLITKTDKNGKDAKMYLIFILI